MRPLSRSLVAVVIATCMLMVTGVTPAGANDERPPKVRVLLEDLNSPKGLARGPVGSLLIAQGAFGPPDPVLLFTKAFGRARTFPVSEPASVVDVAVDRWGTGWALVSEGTEEEPKVVLYRQPLFRQPQAVLDIAAYQLTDPDPYNQDPFGDDPPTASNPYGLAVLPNGDALVVDAANNDLLRVKPNGKTTTVARFDIEMVSTDHLPPEEGLPPEIPAEAVPTSIALAPDGSVYVGELKGFPFRPGSSNVYRVDPGANGALCSATTPDDGCEIVRSGFTSIQDIAAGRHGTLYVYELAAEGAGAFEAGFETGEFPPAVLLKVNLDSRHAPQELAAGLLSQPGGVVVGLSGKVYVTDGMFGNGRLLEVRR